MLYTLKFREKLYLVFDVSMKTISFKHVELKSFLEHWLILKVDQHLDKN